MDFYKKIGISGGKSKETVTSILNEKECKCVSLLAITNEAIKVNNKKQLKELVEEINGHLADLRGISDDSNPKNNAKRDKLVKDFEECLVKIVNNSSLSILSPLNAQLQELNNLTNIAIRDNNYEELQKLAERMERNIAVLKEIPEVKSARNSRNDDDKNLELYNKYGNLLAKVRAHLSEPKKVLCKLEEKQSDHQPPLPPTKIGLNEVEEKLKLMRQKRLNRLSTFVDEQAKLAEQRSGEKSPKGSRETSENCSQPAIRPNEPRENIKPSQYKTAVAAKIPEENERFEGDKEKSKQVVKSEIPVSKREAASGNRGSLGQATAIKSLAERQIENARNQPVPSKAGLRPSQSAKPTPPRTPTQIRKIFNSFNCVQKSVSTHKSIENLPGEFKSHFEHELKNIQLKSVKPLVRPEESKALEKPEEQKPKALPVSKSNSFKVETKEDDENPPVVPPKKIPSAPVKEVEKEKPIAAIRKRVVSRREKSLYLDTENEEKELVWDKNDVLQSHIPPAPPKRLWRSSMDFDSVVVRPHEEPSDVTITIRRESIPRGPSAGRNSFTTFRNSTESVQDAVAVENPLYDVVGLKVAESSMEGAESPLCDSVPKREAVEKIFAEPKTTSERDFNTLDFIIGRRSRKPSYRKQLSMNDGHKFQLLQPDIAKLEYAINMYKGLKRDEDYLTLDKTLSKYYVRVNEVPANSAFEQMEKESLMERLNKAHKDLKVRVEKNEEIMRGVFEEQAAMIALKYGIA